MDKTREEAYSFLIQKLKSVNLQRHCLAVEAIMRALAKHYGEDPEVWGITGLLHDVDYEETKEDLSQHSLLAVEWLSEMGYPEDVVKAIKVHNEDHGVLAETRMEKALIFADAISGLLVAGALIKPSKKIADLDSSSVLKRFKEKDFVRRVSRDEIVRCEKEGLLLADFVSLSLKALQGVSESIGL